MTNQTENLNRVLIIDDNESIHKDFRKIFTSTDDNGLLDELDAELFGTETTNRESVPGFELSFASQGKEGFELLREAVANDERFSMAFVDMRMPPGWDGVVTIAKLWEVDPDLQVVICTAYSDRTWDEILNRLGRTDKLLILKKPFDEIEVTQLATSLCEKRRLLNESRRRMEDLEHVVGRQEVEIEAAHQNAEQIIASMSSVLISLDEDGCVSRWNPVATRVFNIDAADAIGSRFTELAIRWDDKAVVEDLLGTDPDDHSNQAEVQFVDHGDTTHTLDIRVCLVGKNPESKARLLLATDVSRQRALQFQLDQAQRLESVGQLAAGVAHEINTPMQYIGDNVRYVAKSLEKLTGLLDCLPALVDEEVSDEDLLALRKTITDVPKVKKIRSSLQQIPEALADSIDGVETVSRIVAAMKELSHPGSDEKSQVCLNHVLKSTITVARNEWKYVAELKTDFQENLETVAGLPSELNQAFLNIIVNAAHAITSRVDNNDYEKGMIEISTRTTGEQVEVTIRDNGGGIPAGVRDRIFEPFFTTKEVGKGTGQGLAIAHSVIVNKHEGKLWFDVEEQIGTTFTIQIPRSSSPDGSGAGPESATNEFAVAAQPADLS